MLGAVAWPGPGAGAGTTGELRRQQEDVRRQRTALASDIDVLRADDAAVQAALDALNASVSAESARLLDAQNQLVVTREAVVRARATEEATAQRITALEDRLRRMAIDAYMGGVVTDEVQVTLAAEDPDEAVRRDTMLDMVVGDATELADQLAAAREDQTIARQQAEEATAAAERHEAEVTKRLSELQAATDAQAAFAAELDARIERRLAESAALEQLDATLAAEIARQQEELARRSRAIARSRSSRSGGASQPLAEGLVNVGGIVVAESLAQNLAALLAAADADGIALGGGGYRDPGAQRALRARNCPDAASSPAGSCRPPTARPGHSMHEQGLAVDFTYDGGTIQSRSNPAYRWLAANAASYGLYNLPSEPWHWSVNGN